MVTCIDPTWWHCRLRDGDLGYYQLAGLGSGIMEVDPAALTDVMANFRT
jgi:hypothetical protein